MVWNKNLHGRQHENACDDPAIFVWNFEPGKFNVVHKYGWPRKLYVLVRYDQMKDYNFRATISILVVPFGNNFLGHFVANFKEDFLDYMSGHYDQLRRTIQNHNNSQSSFELIVRLPTVQGYVFTICNFANRLSVTDSSLCFNNDVEQNSKILFLTCPKVKSIGAVNCPKHPSESRPTTTQL